MSLEDFGLLDNEPIVKSIKKNGFLKVYHQQRAQLNQSDGNIEFIFGEKNNYHQISNGYLEFDITVRKSDSTNFHYDDPIRLVKFAFAFCFKEARLFTTLGSDVEDNKFCGQVYIIMRVISNKDGDFLSQFDTSNENDIPVPERLADLPSQIKSTPHRKKLINNHNDANKGKIKEKLYLEDIFGLCKIFKKVTENLSFQLMLKVANLQDNIYTSMADDINVTNSNLHLFIPILTTSVEIKLFVNEATQKN